MARRAATQPEIVAIRAIERELCPHTELGTMESSRRPSIVNRPARAPSRNNFETQELQAQRDAARLAAAQQRRIMMDQQRLGWISDSPEQKRQYKEQLHAEMAQQVEEQAVRAASATLQESSVRDTMRVQAQAADSMDQRQQQMRRAYAHQTMLENRQLMEAKLERQRQRKAGEIEADTHNLGVHAERWGRSTLR